MTYNVFGGTLNRTLLLHSNLAYASMSMSLQELSKCLTSHSTISWLQPTHCFLQHIQQCNKLIFVSETRQFFKFMTIPGSLGQLTHQHLSLHASHTVHIPRASTAETCHEKHFRWSHRQVSAQTSIKLHQTVSVTSVFRSGLAITSTVYAVLECLLAQLPGLDDNLCEDN